MTREQLMERAIELAEGNARSGAGGPFGAVVAKDGVVIAEGTNLVTFTNDPTAHAEVVAIRRACASIASFQLAGYELYTSCEPCPMCLGAIYWARPSAIYFAATHADAADAGFDDSLIYEEALKPIAERAIPTRRLLEEEGMRPFAAWRAAANRIPY